MLTLFCSPKPFHDKAEANQLNAMRSWRALGGEVEILVFGDSEGAATAAKEVGAIHIPRIECSPSGAPSFNFMAGYAAEHGRYDLQLYVNADILLDASVVSAFESATARFPLFLLVGERLDLGEGVLLDVRMPAWAMAMESLAMQGKAVLHGPTGVDYFGYRRGIWAGLSPVYMGRAMCDQALLHFCFRKRIPVVDCTMAVLAVHQHHSYLHVKGGSKEVFKGEDYIEMSQAHGLHRSLPTIADADWCLTEGGNVVDTKRRGRHLRELEIRIRYHWRMHYLALAVRALQYLAPHAAIDGRLPTAGHFRRWRSDGRSHTAD